jgi:hypothetical protein
MQFAQNAIFVSAKELSRVIPDECNNYINNLLVQTALHLCSERFKYMRGIRACLTESNSVHALASTSVRLH